MSDIDFVIPYLDWSDPSWQHLYRQYTKEQEGDIETRFRDWGWMKYWLRSVEKNASWVHRIFIVSNNSKPDWLNFDNDKIVWVDHKEFIPHEYLPTFCANTIELNLHRIKQLSEHFVYFNDDMLLNAPVTPDYYFHEGLPNDITSEALFFVPHCDDGTWGTQVMEYCNIGLLNRHFVRRDVVRGNYHKWYGSYLPLSLRFKSLLISFQSRFINFYTPHIEKPFLKSVFQEVWEEEPLFLHNSCTRFRENFTVNVYLMRLWHLATNRFWPSRSRIEGHYYEILPNTVDKICDEIRLGKTPSLCLNDVPSCSHEFYIEAKERILRVLSERYSQKSEFEK